MRFTVPPSVVCTCSLDDSLMRKELGLTHVATDRRHRYVLEGEPRAFVNVIDTCLHMAADHGFEDPPAYAAAKWANRQVPRVLAEGWAKRSPYGGIDPI